MIIEWENGILKIKNREGKAIDKSTLDISCFNGAYKEFVELIGYKNTLCVYDYFAGQYVTFPKRLLSEKFLHKQIIKEFDGTNAKELARKYDYSYSWIMKILKRKSLTDKKS